MNTLYPESSTPGAENDRIDRPKRLLIADTDPGLCWSLDKGLRLSGYEVRSVETADGLLDESMLA